jgi:hypothetical protein
MKSTIGALCLKLNGSAELVSPSRFDGCSVGKVPPRVLATSIASHTVNELVHGKIIEAATVADVLRVYGDNLGQARFAGQCILRFLLPEDGDLATVVRWLNRQVRLHVWEMAHRIVAPKHFYETHPEIAEACKLCGAVVLDAGTPSTITTGSMNPLAGEFLAEWIQSALEHDPSETRPRFFSHVVIPSRHWQDITKAHFGA